MPVHNLENRISKLEKNFLAFSKELRHALQYIQPDAGSSLTKSRIVLERLLIQVYTAEMGREPRKPLLGDMLLDNQFTRKIERRIVSRMNSIRDMGNLGPHGEAVEPNDAARVLDDLCEVLEWYLGKYPVPGSTASESDSGHVEQTQESKTLCSSTATSLSFPPSKDAPVFYGLADGKDVRPSITSLENPNTPRTNLDSPLNCFVGRQLEIDTLTCWLTTDAQRLVTLTGPAGTGKSRLSKQLAHALLATFPGGCWFADLREASTLTGIAYAITQVFGVPLIGDHPEEVVAHILESRPPLLLILDNFEQVTQYAAATVGIWLKRLPRVSFLITSRELLHVYGEREYRLAPLATPAVLNEHELAKLRDYEAVQLFLERGGQTKFGFTLTDTNALSVAKLCVAFEGNPLALELAATFLRILTPSQILSRLGKVQSGLNEAIDLSFRLLSDWEKSAFMQSGVFHGGFFLDAAEQIIDLSAFPDAPKDITDVLQDLYEKSLLRVEETHLDEFRYNNYVAIQAFSRQKWSDLASVEEQNRLAERYAKYFLEYVQEWNHRIHTRVGQQALNRLTLELENVLAIQDGALQRGWLTIAIDIVLAFAETLDIRGPSPLRLPRLKKSLEALGENQSERRASLLIAISHACWGSGDWDSAVAFANQAILVAKDLGRVKIYARALFQQGRMLHERGQRDEARAALFEAHTIYKELADPLGLARVTWLLERVTDSLSEALAYNAEAERWAEKIGDESLLARIFNSRGLDLWNHGDPVRAIACYESALQISRKLGDRHWVGGFLTNQGMALTDMERFDEALAKFTEAEPIHLELGNRAWAAVNIGGRGGAMLRRGLPGDLEASLVVLAEGERMTRAMNWPQETARHLGELGRALLKSNRYAEAQSAIEEALEIQDRIKENRSIRFLGNLVTLACIHELLGNKNEIVPLVSRAIALRQELAFNSARAHGQNKIDLEHLKRFEEIQCIPKE